MPAMRRAGCIWVTPNSIRLRILKDSESSSHKSEVVGYTELDPLEDTESQYPRPKAPHLHRVTPNSIRLRILKDSITSAVLLASRCYTELDPLEDTERSPGSRPVRMNPPGYTELDPLEDTESCPAPPVRSPAH